VILTHQKEKHDSLGGSVRPLYDFRETLIHLLPKLSSF